MSVTRSQAKKLPKQPTRMDARKDKYKNIDNSNSVIAVLNNQSEDRPNVSIGPIRVPREFLPSLTPCRPIMRP